MPTQIFNELSHLAQSLEIKDRKTLGWSKSWRVVLSLIRCAQGNGGMAAVGQAHDGVRVGAVANADHGQLLSAEGMMGMCDGHESQRELG